MKVLQEARQMIYGNVLILGTLVKQSRRHVPPRWAGRGQIGLCSDGEINLDPRRGIKSCSDRCRWPLAYDSPTLPQRRKAKNNIKVTDRQLYSNIIILSNFTSVQAGEKRRQLQIIFIYNLHIYLD